MMCERCGQKFSCQADSQSTDLNICWCNNITDLSLKAIGQNCHLLHTINLVSCDCLTDIGIASLARGCRELQSIDCRFNIKQVHDQIQHKSKI